MNIHIVSGIGHGQTTLSAFDAALQDCGVSNYNLLILSSIIPPGSTIVQDEKYTTDPSHFGDRLYVVMAEKRSRKMGRYIGAGIGWYQFDDGRGLFVEHQEIAETKVAVESELVTKIELSMTDLCLFRNIPFQKDQFHMRTVISCVEDKPTCVLTLAVFQSEPWMR